MLFAADFRKMAREALRGKWKHYGLLMLVAMLAVDALGFGFGMQISGMLLTQTKVDFCWGSCSLFPLDGSAVSLVLCAAMLALLLFSQLVNVGRYRLGAAVLDGREGSLRDLFPLRLLGKCIVVGLVTSFASALPTVVTVIAAINGASLSQGLVNLIMIASTVLSLMLILNFAMANYLLAMKPGMGAIEALSESRRRMAGNRMRYFSFSFSFIGWMMLSTLPVTILQLNLATHQPLLASILYVPISWVASALLNLYISVSATGFFRDVESPRRAQEQSEPFRWNEQAAAGAPRSDEAPRSEPEPERRRADMEPMAREIFHRCGCSRRAMREAGLLEGYEACNVDSSVENRWIQEHGRSLMARFSHEPAALDDILALVGEYALDDLLDRAIERVERHLRQETLPAVELLNMAGRILALVSSGVFADREGYAARKRSQLADFAGRLEEQLMRSEPDGPWQENLNLLRRMCGE